METTNTQFKKNTENTVRDAVGNLDSAISRRTNQRLEVRIVNLAGEWEMIQVW